MRIALLVGINYTGTSAELYGCVNDVDVLEQLLKTKLGFDRVVCLRESDATRKAILKHMYSIALETHRESVDTVWISYSGHGASVVDDSGDELDGRDEVIVPYDYARAGYIRDDEIHNALSKIHMRTQAVVFYDCCYSGTVGDLSYRYVSGIKHVEENPDHSVEGRILMLSACQDSELAGETWGLNDERKFSGAMTAAFVTTLHEYDYNCTAYNLLGKMRDQLKNAGYNQIPQITCSVLLNATTPFCQSRNTTPFLICSDESLLT